jgi:hypothetical protein
MYTPTHDQLRIQCIWKTNQGGNDHNHVHVGARPGLSVFLCTRVVQSGRQADGGGLSKQAGGPIAAIVRRRRDAALVRRVVFTTLYPQPRRSRVVRRPPCFGVRASWRVVGRASRRPPDQWVTTSRPTLKRRRRPSRSEASGPR